MRFMSLIVRRLCINLTKADDKFNISGKPDMNNIPTY